MFQCDIILSSCKSDVTVEYKGADRDEDKEKPDEDNKTGKNTGQGSEHQEDRVEKASEIMTQPGILAGVYIVLPAAMFSSCW